MTCIKPYSDNLMRWDEVQRRYFLTETALVGQGIDIRSRVLYSHSPAPENIINGLLNTVTAMIYGYIHEHNTNTRIQDDVIASFADARVFLYNALLAQAKYVWFNGDLSISPKKEERDAAISPVAMQELGQIIPDVGRSILFCGGY